MAIDRNRTKEFIRDIESLFETAMGPVSEDTITFIKNKVMGPAFKEITDLIGESRPPVLFLLGRSGHGKSSLINALANKEVAKVGHIGPESYETTRYTVSFEGKYASWEVIDSRGIFETTTPAGASSKSAVEVLKQDLLKYKPDVILHVITASETRALEADTAVLKEISGEFKRIGFQMPPSVAILTKVDCLGNPKEWPPEQYPRKASTIGEVISYMASGILHATEINPLDLNKPMYGCRFESPDYLAVIPVCTLADEEDRWNIDVLSEYISEQLPKSALLAFVQAQNRKTLLRKISSSLIKRFSDIAAVIGATPIPVADMVVLIPLQTLMIATIGGLSCRVLSKETANEYLGAASMNLGAAFGARELVRVLTEITGPVTTAIISGAMAKAVTFGIGKSAEHYFFKGEVKSPKEFKDS